RLPRAVAALVVVADHQGARPEEVERRHELGADQRMVPHDRPLFVFERTGLSQDRLGDTDLAYIVEKPRLADHVDVSGGKAERGRDAAAPGADSLGMTPRVCVLPPAGVCG